MTWIRTVPYKDATGALRRLYDRIKGPDNNVDNIMLAHSLRPHSMEGHMALYKHVLHHPRNELPKWYLEAIGVYVSLLNKCGYCAQHHCAAGDIDALRAAGFDDGEILEINQVTAYFGYANRTVLGLGISTDGDIIGLSPGDSRDPDNWSHR